MTPYTIVLADDHVILRQGLKRILEGAPDIAVVGEADNGLDLVRLVKRVTCDLVILDVSMPGLRGIEAIPEVRAAQPYLKILILTMHRDLELLNAALSAGANGYVLKEDAETQLFAAIGKIRKGGTYVSPKLADEMTHDWARGRRTDAPPAAEIDRLTLREKQILKLTAEGNSSREISGLLCISSRTVEHHRANIMTKLRLKKTADVIRYALHGGYL
jgi:DNA-binding NarL/FixJ family response regulator